MHRRGYTMPRKQAALLLLEHSIGSEFYKFKSKEQHKRSNLHPNPQRPFTPSAPWRKDSLTFLSLFVFLLCCSASRRIVRVMVRAQAQTPQPRHRQVARRPSPRPQQSLEMAVRPPILVTLRPRWPTWPPTTMALRATTNSYSMRCCTQWQTSTRCSSSSAEAPLARWSSAGRRAPAR